VWHSKEVAGIAPGFQEETGHLIHGNTHDHLLSVFKSMKCCSTGRVLIYKKPRTKEKENKRPV
jgi:hypothetical protein